MNYGTRIKQRRQQMGISAEELAHRIGKSRATVYRYESGEIEDMPITVLDPLARALNTTPAYLMGWTDDPQDWEQIGNDEGIYPPKDYVGSYEEYVKFKVHQEQEDLIDDYENTLYDAILYLENLDCEILEDSKTDDVTVITPDGRNINTKAGTLVYNYKIFGSTNPSIKRLTTLFEDSEDPKEPLNKQAIDTVAAHLVGKNITPKKLKLIEQYIDALFEEDEEDNQ